MIKIFPYIFKDIGDVLIYLPQALCACGIYAILYGVLLGLGSFATKHRTTVRQKKNAGKAETSCCGTESVCPMGSGHQTESAYGMESVCPMESGHQPESVCGTESVRQPESGHEAESGQQVQTRTGLYGWLKNGWHFVGSSLFVIYAWVLVMIVFFCREPGSRIGTNLQVMGTWGTTLQDHAWVIENLVLFLPFGFLFPVWLGRKREAWTILLGFLCSAAIEYTQLRTGRGFCQLDDVIMNTLGTIIGFFIWKAVHAFYVSAKI